MKSDPVTGTVSFDPGPAAPPTAAPASAAEDPRFAAVPPQVVALTKGGTKTKAIKLYRQLTSADLKSAKKVADGL